MRSLPMPRLSRPRWSARRGRWYANIGDRDANGRAGGIFAPAEIPERDEAGAWEWFRAERARREAKVVAPADLSVEAICELYLQWAEGRFEEGRLNRQHYLNKAVHLGHFVDALG